MRGCRRTYAAQWLARAARAYVPVRPDDSHTNFGWDGGFGALVTHPLPDGSRLGLRIADLTLALLGNDRVELSLDGRAEPEVRAWLGAEADSGGPRCDASSTRLRPTTFPTT